jgi:multiple sugar transport system permease protein
MQPTAEDSPVDLSAGTVRRGSVNRRVAPVRSFIDRHFLVFASWPSMLIMLAVTAVPFAITIALAFTNYDLVRSNSWKFIGLQNFDRMIHDSQIPTIVFNTAYLVVGSTVLDTVFGLALAVLLDARFRAIGFIRSLFMLPIMTAPIVVALTWRAMFNNDAGWINYFLKLAHLPQPLWLGDPHLAMPAVLISDMWTGIPFQAILLLAGLVGVSKELKEAAVSDGANIWQVFWHVTLPGIRPVLFIAVVLRFIDAFRKFEGIQILTTGGPGIASTPLNLQIYNTGLFYHQVGYAAAMGVLLIALIAASVGALYLIAGRRG